MYYQLLIAHAQNAPIIHAGQVLSELEYTLGHMQRMLNSNPYDNKLKTDVDTMLQVGFMLLSCDTLY